MFIFRYFYKVGDDVESKRQDSQEVVIIEPKYKHNEELGTVIFTDFSTFEKPKSLKDSLHTLSGENINEMI